MELIVPILLNCTLVLCVYLADRYTFVQKLPYMAKQIIVGVLFGGVSAFASSYGVEWLGTIVNVRDADYVVGPIGMVIADSMLGEITPAMAVAIGSSPAKKVLIPSLKCNNYVVGTKDITLDKLVDLAVEEITN